MFDKFYRQKLPDITLLSKLADYQLFLIYSYNCDDEFASEPIMQQQMKPEFYSLHYLHPRCLTHQLFWPAIYATLSMRL